MKNITFRSAAAMIVALVITAALIYWRRTSNHADDTEPNQQRLDATHSDAKSPSSGSNSKTSRSQIEWDDIGVAVANIRNALSKNDPHGWQSAMGELRNSKYQRTEAVKALIQFLNHENWDVRILAGQLLLELGSEDGVPILKEALKLAASGHEISSRMANKAAAALSLAGIPIDAADLATVYRKYPSFGLLDIGARQGHRWVEDVVHDARRTGGYSQSVEIAAGALGMNDSESRQRFEELVATPDLEAQIVGNWGLYRATGSTEAMQRLVAIARQTAGLAPKNDSNMTSSRLAAGLLSVTESPAVDQLMRDIVNRAASGQEVGPFGYDDALRSLYFVQKNYEFIDQQILASLSGQTARGVGGDLLWRIAAIRRTPEIEQAAMTKNPTAYELIFVRMQGYPLYFGGKLSKPSTAQPGGT